MATVLKLQFENITALPLNMIYSTNIKTGRRFKSKKYAQFQSEIKRQLRTYKADLNRFNKAFCEDEHYITAEFRFYKPIMTKKNKRISKTSGDTSNMIKTIEDLIFKELHADDSFVINLTAMKIHSEHPRIEVNLYLKNLNQIS